MRNKIDQYKFIYTLLFKLNLLHREDENINIDNNDCNINYKKIILDTLIKLNQNHSIYIDKILNIWTIFSIIKTNWHYILYNL